MVKNIAIVSDATSPGFWYPTWLQYYGKHFGRNALHLICYEDSHPFFEYSGVGNIICIPQKYDDRLRASFISSYVNTLLLCNDYVLRCDIDEILFPDLRNYSNIKDYVSVCKHSHVTAIGFDVIQDYKESSIDFDHPILFNQRKIGIPYSSLNKTALTAVQTEWCPGFHGCTLQPNFDQLFLAHLKLADFDNRISWHDHMLINSIDGGSEQVYYSDARAKLNLQRDYCLGKTRISGWNGLRQNEEMLGYLASIRSLKRENRHDFYLGRFDFAKNACLLPEELSVVI